MSRVKEFAVMILELFSATVKSNVTLEFRFLTELLVVVWAL